MGCECCEEINFWKESISKYQELKTSIVIERKDKRSTLTVEKFNLNYCPMCGQRIEMEWI